MWNNDIFKTENDYKLDYELYVFRKINEYLAQKTYRSPGSPTRKGYTVLACIHKNDFEKLFREFNQTINYEISFKDNYKTIRKYLHKLVLEFLAKELGVEKVFFTKEQIYKT